MGTNLKIFGLGSAQWALFKILKNWLGRAVPIGHWFKNRLGTAVPNAHQVIFVKKIWAVPKRERVKTIFNPLTISSAQWAPQEPEWRVLFNLSMNEIMNQIIKKFCNLNRLLLATHCGIPSSIISTFCQCK